MKDCIVGRIYFYRSNIELKFAYSLDQNIQNFIASYSWTRFI